MSALLTDEAVRAADEQRRRTGNASTLNRLDAFLDFHRTEGREALVEAVAQALVESPGWTDDMAEAVVTALVGKAD